MNAFAESRFGFHEESDFTLPIPGLFADLESGRGAVALTDDFLEAPAHVRAKVLQHWIRHLSEGRNQAIVDMFRDARRSDGEPSSIVDEIERFREECQDAGLTCPADLPLLLQRY